MFSKKKKDSDASNLKEKESVSEKNSEIRKREEKIRENLKIKYETEKNKIIKAIEEQKNKQIDEKRESLQKL